ncbi:hypothetical protein [Paenibacillus elgii]|uniref:hypothetical protein n=1 Tax=Paenibacillus elgii TaxID=189691 RepID=UPI0020424A37|nr:hypothetical protein [Paenibacillus elgii]MCM3273072.1 hypothetical protein [Paenibacillus elgii]
MAKINLNKLSSLELVDLYNRLNKVLFSDTIEDKKRRIEEKSKKWLDKGQYYCEKRLERNISMAEMGRFMGCSAKKIKAFETGKPVQAPYFTEISYSNALRLFDLENSADKRK